MREQDLQYIRTRVHPQAKERWESSKQYAALALARNEAMKAKNFYVCSNITAEMDKCLTKIEDRLVKECVDAINMVRNAKSGMNKEDSEKFGLHALRSFILLDMLENDLMEIKEMTIHLKVGNYNPICPELLEELLDEVRGQLGFVYKGSERDVIKEFVNGTDRLDDLFTQTAKSMMKKIDKRLGRI